MLCDVVFRWAESARDDDYIALRQSAVEGLGNALGTIADRGALEDYDTRSVELLRQVSRVGVENLTNQNLVANGYDCRFHLYCALLSACSMSERQILAGNRAPL